MKLSGRLGAYALADLVCVLGHLEFQGTLRLRCRDEQALLVFDGEAIYFPLPLARKRRRVRLRAERLLKRICSWSKVEFDSLPGRTPTQDGGQFRVSVGSLQRICEEVPGARELVFNGTLRGQLLSDLAGVFSDRRITGVLLVDDGSLATSVFFHSGMPFRRVSAREPRRPRGEVIVRWVGGPRFELVEHPERFLRIRRGWPAFAA